MVEVVTQWPGHAAEEVERLITVPVENGMNGLPKLKVVRSISLYGLSDVRLTFEDGTDNYFARQQAFERIARHRAPRGVDARHLAALVAVRSRLPLRAREPRPLGDGAQDPPGLGARASSTSRCPASPTSRRSAARRWSTRCCSIPRKLAGAGLSVADVADGARREQRQRRRRILLRGRPVLLRARPRPPATLEDIGNVVLAVNNGTPVLVKDVGRRRHRPRAATRPVRLQ